MSINSASGPHPAPPRDLKESVFEILRQQPGMHIHTLTSLASRSYFIHILFTTC
jgi:hypothetical protein